MLTLPLGLTLSPLSALPGAQAPFAPAAEAVGACADRALVIRTLSVNWATIGRPIVP